MKIWVAGYLIISTLQSISQSPQKPIGSVGDVTNSKNGTIFVGNGNSIVMRQVGPIHQQRDIKSVVLDEVVKLHIQAEGYNAVIAFDKPSPPNPVYNPRMDNERLLSPSELEARVSLLNALKRYAQSLVDQDQNVTTYALDDAEAGDKLIDSGTIDRFIDFRQIARFPVQNHSETETLDADINKLGKYLAAPKTKSGIPKLMIEMDPTIRNICQFMIRDTDVLRANSTIDFDRAIDLQTLYLRMEVRLPSFERNREIRILPQLANAVVDTDRVLANLVDALKAFELAHHALAVQLQSHSNSFNSRIISLLSASTGL